MLERMSSHSQQALERSARHRLDLPGPLGRLVARLERWYRERIFAVELASLPKWSRRLNLALRVVYLSSRGFVEDRCLFRASALTYITVLSLVPLLAFAFALAKGFGFYETLREKSIEPFLDSTFGTVVPSSPAPGAADFSLAPQMGSSEMRAAIERVLAFVDHTHVGGLGAAGLIFLLYTVIKLLSTIEQSFNDIWGVQRARTLVRKLTDYLAMVVVTPILLFLATAITTAAQNSSVVQAWTTRFELGELFGLVLRLTPLFSLWVAFAFLYLALPNTRTRLSSALLGAVVGGTLWQLTLLAHLEFQIGVARYNAIYAGFAAFPIFLMWIQISWVTVLLGAQVCFAHQSAPSYWPESPQALSVRSRESVALRVMVRIASRALAGAEAWTTSALAKELNVSLRPLERVLHELVDARLLAWVRGGDGDSLILAVDMDRIHVQGILEALEGPLPPGESGAGALDRELAEILHGMEEVQGDSRWNLPLRVLAERARELEAGRSTAASGPVFARG
jgi:membrane protein